MVVGLQELKKKEMEELDAVFAQLGIQTAAKEGGEGGEGGEGKKKKKNKVKGVSSGGGAAGDQTDDKAKAAEAEAAKPAESASSDAEENGTVDPAVVRSALGISGRAGRGTGGAG